MATRILIWFLFGLVSAIVAQNKGRSGCGWFAAGVLLGPFGLLLAFAAPRHLRASGNSKGIESGPILLIAVLAVVITVVGFLVQDTKLWYLLKPGLFVGAIVVLAPALFPALFVIVSAANIAFWFAVLYTLYRVTLSLRIFFGHPAPSVPRFHTREEYEAWKRSQTSGKGK